MSTRGPVRQIQFSLMGLAICAWFFELGDLDLHFQDALYNIKTQSWLLDRHNLLLREVFYDGPKLLLILLVLAIAASLFLFRKAAWFSPYQGSATLLLLSMLIVPGTITGLKNITNVACPAELVRYGGELPYVKVFDTYPEGQSPIHRQRCFPAGHASGGFALLALFYLPRSQRRRYIALATALLIGSLMGGYKMLIGHHFLSHTLVTALLSWLMIHAVILLLPSKWRPHSIVNERGRPLGRYSAARLLIE